MMTPTKPLCHTKMCQYFLKYIVLRRNVQLFVQRAVKFPTSHITFFQKLYFKISFVRYLIGKC